MNPVRLDPSVRRRASVLFLVPALLVALTALPPAIAQADCIAITEVVTDPEQDHSESSGGNGTPFDLIPGSGTVSSVDEYLELFNTGLSAVSLEHWILEFLDTTPATYEFGVSTGGRLRFSSGSSLDSLQPGGFALLGNPPGAMNNTIEIVLRDPLGIQRDSVAIEGGASSGPGDEALARVWSECRWTADLTRTSVSPLALSGDSFFHACDPAVPPPTAPEVPMQPTPEPGSLVLIGASLLAVFRANARRSRRARRRSG